MVVEDNLNTSTSLSLDSNNEIKELMGTPNGESHKHIKNMKLEVTKRSSTPEKKKSSSSLLGTKSKSSKKSKSKEVSVEQQPQQPVLLEPESEVEHMERKKRNEIKEQNAHTTHSLPELSAVDSEKKRHKKIKSNLTPKSSRKKKDSEKAASSLVVEEINQSEKTTLEPGQSERESQRNINLSSTNPTSSTSTESIIILNTDSSSSSPVITTSKRKKKKSCHSNSAIFDSSCFDEKKVSRKSSKHKKKKRSRSNIHIIENNNGEDSDSSLEDFCGEFLLDDSDHHHHNKKNDYTCLTESDIIAEQAREIEEVSEILSINPSIAIALLKFFKWNKDKLLTSYFDNPAKVLKDSGINLSEENAMAPIFNSEEDSMECSICGEECTSQDSHAIKPCSHRFCNICWNQYLTMKITEGQAAYINCPHFKCLSLVQEPTVKLMVDEVIYRKYCMFLMKSFVEDNENVKWCPAPNCGNAITSDMISQRKTVSCICGYRFCFQCSEEAHLPATCEHLKLWKKKCQDESETQNWIAANTQECPKCSLPTEKNGGCNHMTCRQCKYEYCWICLKDWKGHNDYYTCNRYQKKEEKSSKTKKGSKKERELQRIEMRRALEKYLHYYSRYMNHARSSELERIRDKAMRKMHEMQETEATSAEVLFIKQATDRLIECRSVLKYTYVLHYYMEDSPQKDLFEYLQEDLEKTAELLSEALENPMRNKMNVVNLTVLAETRLNNLLDAVDNGDISY